MALIDDIRIIERVKCDFYPKQGDLISIDRAINGLGSLLEKDHERISQTLGYWCSLLMMKSRLYVTKKQTIPAALSLLDSIQEGMGRILSTAGVELPAVDEFDPFSEEAIAKRAFETDWVALADELSPHIESREALASQLQHALKQHWSGAAAKQDYSGLRRSLQFDMPDRALRAIHPELGRKSW